MKTLIPVFVIIPLYFIFPKTNANHDPFTGNYILGNSAELIYQYNTIDDSLFRLVYDYDTTKGFNASYYEKNVNLYKCSGNKAMSVVAGDINGDNIDEIISAWECENHSIAISIPALIKDSMVWKSQELIVLDSVLNSSKNSSIKLLLCNLDKDMEKEIVLAYAGLDNYLHISLYQIDRLNNLSKTTEIQEYKFITDSLFDIAAGDFDADGFDEIFAIQPTGSEFVETNLYKASFSSKIYDYNQDLGIFVAKRSNDLSVVNDFSYGIESHPSLISRVVAAAGNFDDLIGDEVVFGFEEVAYWLTPEFTNAINDRFYDGICILKISANLDSISLENSTELQNYPGDWSQTEFHLSGHSLSVCVSDLNIDGTDEIIGLGIDILKVFTVNNYEFTEVGKLENDWQKTLIPWTYSYKPCNIDFNNNNNLIMAVADLNADTLTLDNKIDWFPEIVVAGFIGTYSPFLWYYVYSPDLDISGNITGISAKNNGSIGLNRYNYEINSFAIALGDFNGDGIRLGKPTILEKTDILIPSIILNAPPSHFDIIDGEVIDINSLFPIQERETTANTLYINSNTSEETTITESKKSWGVSSDLSAKTKLFGVGISASVNAKYGEDFKKSTTETKTVTIKVGSKADNDDRIYGMTTSYNLYEYPVLYKGHNQGTLLVSIPDISSSVWNYSKLADFKTYSLSHEPNCLLSYPDYNQITEIPDFMENGGSYLSNTWTPLYDTPNANFWHITFSDFSSSTIAREETFSLSSEFSTSGLGLKAGLKGDYSNSYLASHKTSVQEGFEVQFNLDRINPDYLEATYKLMPCIYWSNKGALVIDYLVDLNGDWWAPEGKYSDKSDPAFIMPFRYNPEKGEALKYESKRMLTSDIRYTPYDAKPGDTITIQAKIRNFSLKDMDQNAKVIFYLGDPADGGEKITSLAGTSEYILNPIKYRQYSEISFDWKTPDKIPSKPWIFAIIYPENPNDDLHLNNNKGWIPLWTESFPPYFPLTEIHQIKDDFLLSAYPNPSRNITTIGFTPKNIGKVKINIYNTTSQIIEQREIYCGSMGRQHVVLDVSKYKPGIYFYELVSDNFRATSKMIVE